ncbi:MAG: tetratricopeptide repeat protein, partial [Porticoccaceae bacterium]|nr:tetratricopeptide repeat protein [Porticoccaceae bacterium]
MSSWTVAADVIIVPLFTDGSAPVNDLDPISLQPIETLVGLVKTQQWTNARLTADLLAEQFEGLPRFDLYLGLLQMAEGDFNEAIFSFERVLIFVPDQHRARLELGRAYFLSANYDRARSELEQVLATAPPPEVRQNINQLLSRIDRAQSQARTRISFGGTLLGGWDNNGNGGGNAKGLLDPNLSGATALDSASSAIASPYAQLTLHASRFRPTSRSASRRLSADFSTKNFIDPELSDSSALTLTSTVFSQNERLRFQLPASAQWSWLAGQSWQAMLD